MDVEDLQRQYYNKLLDRYASHYDDPTSQAYRRRFIFEPMFEGIHLRGSHVLEAMCGSGPTTGYMLMRGANVTGLDVSDVAVSAFEARWPDCQGVRSSILDSEFEDDAFDVVVIQAGLHHLHPHVDAALAEVHRILKPGGHFCFSEPHAGSVYDGMRNLWYRFDREIFAENEASVDLVGMKRKNSELFDFNVEHYIGNIAYFLVLQSMVLRIPLGAKRYYAPPLLWFEGWINKLQGRRSAPLVACQWQKRGNTAPLSS